MIHLRRRMKLLSVHNMVSWSCFHLVKNNINATSAALPDQPSLDNATATATAKLIHSDGLVQIYHRPINVSEVLLDFPKHLVCRSDSFYIGQKIPPLSEHDQLQLGHKYFLLPRQFFHSVLSFLTITSFFAPPQNNNNNNARFINNAAACQHPFDIQRSPSGCLKIRVSDEFISRLLEQGNSKFHQQPQSPPLPLGKICSTPQLAKDYTQLVRTRQWKPKLETIPESKKKGISQFGLKKTKQFHSQVVGLTWTRSSNYPPLHHLRSIQFAYKPKMRFKSRAA